MKDSLDLILHACLGLDPNNNRQHCSRSRSSACSHFGIQCALIREHVLWPLITVVLLTAPALASALTLTLTGIIAPLKCKQPPQAWTLSVCEYICSQLQLAVYFVFTHNHRTLSAPTVKVGKFLCATVWKSLHMM